MSMFANAKTVTAKKGKPEPETVALTGLENFARIAALVKNFDAVKKTLEGEVKSAMRSIFMASVYKMRKKPDNFRAAEGVAEASCELRRRSSASVLTDEEVATLESLSVPYAVLAGNFIINPAYAADEKLLNKVSKALEKVAGLPDDFILREPDKRVVSDKSLEKACEIGSDVAFDIVTTLAIRPKLETVDIGGALELARKMVG